MRYVFDTNVIISALLFNNSVPGSAFFQALNRGKIITSQKMLNELEDVLGREKLNKYVTYEEREEFLEKLIQESELIEDYEEISICRDPKDNKVLELAVAGKASVIITGDDDLLVLNPFSDIQIVSPSDFLELNI